MWAIQRKKFANHINLYANTGKNDVDADGDGCRRRREIH
jgi:hypothetical protein